MVVRTYHTQSFSVFGRDANLEPSDELLTYLVCLRGRVSRAANYTPFNEMPNQMNFQIKFDLPERLCEPTIHKASRYLAAMRR